MRYMSAKPVSGQCDEQMPVGALCSVQVRVQNGLLSEVNWENAPVLIEQSILRVVCLAFYATPRVRFILETRWEFAGKPTEGWVWPH